MALWIGSGIGAVAASRIPEPKLAPLLARANPARRFAFPVGGGTAREYYDAQPFGENRHLGSDWNGTGGGDTDRGDPVLAIADGVVISARDHRGGWGRVVRIVHNAGTAKAPRYVESLYAHLATMSVRRGSAVRRGQVIGTIGTAHGRYRAHLHLELRSRIGLALGRGYGERTAGQLDPTAFIRARR